MRDHFREQASSFDSLYDDEASLLNRVARPALYARKRMVEDAIKSRKSPRVLDIGCGSGRVAETMLEAGAGEYVGVDFSEPMVDLARKRLERFEDRVSLVSGDFRTAQVPGDFDLIIALGVFDYLEDAHTFTRRIRELCRPGGSFMANFGRWDWLKGPIRILRYEVINSCPIYHYTQRELELLMLGSGFDKVDMVVGRSGFWVNATR